MAKKHRYIFKGGPYDGVEVDDDSPFAPEFWWNYAVYVRQNLIKDGRVVYFFKHMIKKKK